MAHITLAVPHIQITLYGRVQISNGLSWLYFCLKGPQRSKTILYIYINKYLIICCAWLQCELKVHRIGIREEKTKKMRLKLWSAKWRPFSLYLNVLCRCGANNRPSANIMLDCLWFTCTMKGQLEIVDQWSIRIPTHLIALTAKIRTMCVTLTCDLWPIDLETSLGTLSPREWYLCHT